MLITNQTLTHLASLSRLELSEAETFTLKTDLNNILAYTKKLDELDTENVEPTFQVIDLENIWRPDEILPQDATPDDLLNLSPETQNHQIKVPKVL